MDPYNQSAVTPLVDYPEQQQDLYPPLQHTLYPPQQQTPYPQQHVLRQQSPPPFQAHPLPQKHGAMKQAPSPQQVASQSSSATVYKQALTSSFKPRDIGYRVPARVIAFLDITASIFSCIVLVYFIIGWANAIGEAKSKTAKYALLYVCIFVSIIGIITLLIEVYIAWQLVSATELGASPTYAIGKARRWRNYNIFLLILTLVTASLSLGGGSHLGSLGFLFLVVRLICVYIVHRFIQGLEYSMMMTATPVTMDVTRNQAQSHWHTEPERGGEGSFTPFAPPEIANISKRPEMF